MISVSDRVKRSGVVSLFRTQS